MNTWPLHEAKKKLSDVLTEAQRGAQVITVRGREVAVVLTIEDYQRLVRPAADLVTFLRESPLAEVELDLERSTDVGRAVDR